MKKLLLVGLLIFNACKSMAQQEYRILGELHDSSSIKIKWTDASKATKGGFWIDSFPKTSDGGITDTTGTFRFGRMCDKIICAVWHSDGRCNGYRHVGYDTLPVWKSDEHPMTEDEIDSMANLYPYDVWTGGTVIYGTTFDSVGTVIIGDAGVWEEDFDYMIQPKFVQVRNPRTKRYQLIDIEKGRIVTSSRRKYKDIPLVK